MPTSFGKFKVSVIHFHLTKCFAILGITGINASKVIMSQCVLLTPIPVGRLCIVFGSTRA